MLTFDAAELSHGQLPGSLELAYIGDTIYDLFVRTRLVLTGGRMKQLNISACNTVCAHAQSEALARVESMLNDSEADVVRRARNAKQSPAKHAIAQEYHRATALEALIGYLYLTGQCERLDQIMNAALCADGGMTDGQ